MKIGHLKKEILIPMHAFSRAMFVSGSVTFEVLDRFLKKI